VEACGHALIWGTVPDINWEVWKMTRDFRQNNLCTDRDYEPETFRMWSRIVLALTAMFGRGVECLNTSSSGNFLAHAQYDLLQFLICMIGQRLYCICLRGMSGYPFIQIPRQKRVSCGAKFPRIFLSTWQKSV